MTPQLIKEESECRDANFCTMIGGEFSGHVLEISPLIGRIELTEMTCGTVASREDLESTGCSGFVFLPYIRREDNPLYFDFDWRARG